MSPACTGVGKTALANEGAKGLLSTGQKANPQATSEAEAAPQTTKEANAGALCDQDHGLFESVFAGMSALSCRLSL